EERIGVIEKDVRAIEEQRDIASAPARAAALFARKIALLFNRAHVFLNYSYPFFAYDARTLLGALPVGAWLLVPLGIIGLASRGSPPVPRAPRLAPRAPLLAPRPPLLAP